MKSEGVLFEGAVEYGACKGRGDYFWIIRVDMGDWEESVILAARDDFFGRPLCWDQAKNEFLFSIPEGTPVEVIVRVK